MNDHSFANMRSNLAELRETRDRLMGRIAELEADNARLAARAADFERRDIEQNHFIEVEHVDIVEKLQARVASLEDAERIAWALTAAQRMEHRAAIRSGADLLGVLLPTGDTAFLPLDSSLPLTPEARAAIDAAKAESEKQT